jgi:hypothetical protein
MKHYGAQISSSDALDSTIHKLCTWLNAQSDSSAKMVSAKRCLKRMTETDYNLVDEISKVSTRQLLALFWIAIHDETYRTGNLADAKSQLIEGLYEIQRDGNLSETGVDNNDAKDLTACPSGSFNKIVEKGCGLHPEMNITFLTLQVFSLKLHRLVSEEAMAYLRKLDNETSRPLIEAIKEEGNANSVSPIWDAIWETVAAKMFNEFGTLFENNKAPPRFLEEIAAGEYTRLTTENLKELDQLISKIPPEGGENSSATIRDNSTATPHPDGFFTSGNQEEQAMEESEIFFDCCNL